MPSYKSKKVEYYMKKDFITYHFLKVWYSYLKITLFDWHVIGSKIRPNPVKEGGIYQRQKNATQTTYVII